MFLQDTFRKVHVSSFGSITSIEHIARNRKDLIPHYASISTAITIATFIATNVLVRGISPIMQQ
jgi:hypothetical protein